MILNLTAGNTGSSTVGGTGAELTVHAPVGASVTIQNGETTYTKSANESGIAVFQGLTTGLWSVTASEGTQSSLTQYIQVITDYALYVSFFAATIAITYPEGDTCICSKGDIVLTAPDTSGIFTAIVPEPGTWEVSCNNGLSGGAYREETVAVSVTTDGENVPVLVAYKKYLYNTGDSCTSITGGWKAYNYACPEKLVTVGGNSRIAGLPTFNLGATSATVQFMCYPYDDYYRVGSVFTENKVQREEFTTVRIHVKNIDKDSFCKVYLTVTNAKQDKYQFLAYTEITEAGETVLDIPNTEEALYVTLCLQNAGIRTATKDTVVEFDRIWLQ